MNNDKDGKMPSFKFVKYGRHKATPWLDIVAKPWRTKAVAFKGFCTP